MVVGDLESGCIVQWNAAAERLFDYQAAQAIGKPMDMLMPPAVARLHRERLAHYARTGETEVLDPRECLYTPALTCGGDEIRTELLVVPVEPPSAGVARRHVLLIFRDASQDQQAALQALEAARVESARVDSETKLRQSEDLLRDGALELKSGLARAERAAARLAHMAASGDTPPERLACLARVVEARRAALQRTIEQIDDRASIQSGTFELACERVNLVPLIGRIVATARLRSPAHRLNVAAPQGLTATGDPQRLEQVLRTLIDRAVRRNPRGCWIDVDARRPLAGLAQIEVRDYGRPMSTRARARVTSGREWSVCQYIVEQHGGTLSVEFPTEGGLRAIFTLPTNGGRVVRAPV
jgi:PAS domain S-box-containing protein